MQQTRRRTFAAAPAAAVALPATRKRPAAAAGTALAALFACALLDLSPAAAAETIAPGARLAATCTGCHGTNGATAGNSLPALAGQSKEALLASLQAFKAGTRPATIMTQLAKGYSDEQLAQMAAFFAAQPAPRAATAAATVAATQGARP